MLPTQSTKINGPNELWDAATANSSENLRKLLLTKPYISVGPGCETRTSGCTIRNLTRDHGQDWKPRCLSARLILHSDGASFHTNGKTKRHKVRIWWTENHHDTLEKERDSRKFNPFCASSKEKLYGYFFYVENPVSENLYLGMPTLRLRPNWKRILTAVSPNPLGRRLTSTWQFGNTFKHIFLGDELVLQEPVASCGAGGGKDRQT